MNEWIGYSVEELEALWRRKRDELLELRREIDRRKGDVVKGAEGASEEAFGVAKIVRRCENGTGVRLEPGEMRRAGDPAGSGEGRR